MRMHVCMCDFWQNTHMLAFMYMHAHDFMRDGWRGVWVHAQKKNILYYYANANAYTLE